MKLHLLEKCIDDFLVSQQHSQQTYWWHPHEIVNQFHTQWTQTSPEALYEVYDQSVKSEISQRWWKRDQYRPKEIMLHLITADPELALIAFKDLFNDSAKLDGRLSRFDFYCTDLLKMHKEKNPGSIESYHHQDASMVSLYLAGVYPDQYSLYPGLKVFQKFCETIGAIDIPPVDDLFRYAKISKIVFTYLQKNDVFKKLEGSRIRQSNKITFIPYQVVYEFVSFAGGNPDLII